MATCMSFHGPKKPLCLRVRPRTVSPVTLTLPLILREDTEDTVLLQSAPHAPARPNPETPLTATTLNAAVTDPKLLSGPCPPSRGC